MRYLRVLLTFYKAALLTNLEYRAGFWAGALLSVVSAVWQVAGVSLFFLHTDRLGDWVYAEVLLVIGLYVAFLGVIEMVLYPNVQELIRHIRKGTMDFILTKPIDSQFHASLRRIEIWKGVDIVLGIGITLFALSWLPARPALPGILAFLFLCLCAIVILYALTMLLITSAFWFVRLDNVMELLFTFFDAGRFPVTIFPFWLRLVLTIIVPIAFVTTVPAAVLLGRFEPIYIVYAAVVAAGLLLACIAFWRFAVRFYSSASS